MTKADKDLQKIRSNKNDVSKEKLITVLKRYDCIITEGGKGSHFGVSHQLIERTLTIPTKKPIKSPYVKDCLNLIDEIIALSEE